jgi:adenine phosphoribosyltransferase
MAASGGGVMSAEYLALIDTQTQGPRYDVTPLFGNAAAFSALVDDLLALVDTTGFEVVAGIDALGFILGAALALRAGKGFLPVRKGGKLPVAADVAEFVDYTGNHKSLELRRDALVAGTRVLLVDEWIETGAQASAAVRLIEARGSIIVGIAAIHIDTNERTKQLVDHYPCYQVWADG